MSYSATAVSKIGLKPKKKKTTKKMLRPMLGIYHKMSEPNSINRNVNEIAMVVKNKRSHNRAST